MSIWKKAISVGLSASLLASLLATIVAPAAFAAVTVTAATGGTAISADTTGGSYTALTGPVVAEGAAGDISTGLLTFNAPSGFVFDTGGTNPSFTGGGTTFAMAFVSRTSSSITYQVTAASTVAGTVTFTNWRVRPSAGTPLATGNITFASGGATINGATAGSTNFGTLTEVAGAANKYLVTSTSYSPAAGATVTINAQQTDQFGNATTTAATVIWTQTSTGATGTFSAPSSATNGSGLATVNFTVGVAGTVYTVSGTDGSGRTGTSAAITVASPAPTGITSGGSVTVTHALSVPRGNGYVDATGASLTFTEGTKTDFGTGFSFILNIAPASPGAGSVSFDTSKAISVTAPDSLALTAKFLNAQQILIASAPSVTTDQANIELFSIGNLHVKAAAGTTLGSIRTFISGSTGSIANSYWTSATTTATGLLQFSNYPAGSTGAWVLQTSTCAFGPTTGVAGKLNFADNAESVSVTSTTGSGIGATYFINLASATSNPHAIGAGVSQTVANCGAANTISSIGTVVDALLLGASGTPGVQAGLNNQPAGDVTITEQAAGFIPSGTTCTLSVSEPGVLISSAASAVGTNGLISGTKVANLSMDRKSLSFSTDAASSAAGMITVSGIKYDVAATATLGDAVMVTVTCGSLLIAPTSVQNAFINNAITQVAAAPTVWIGYNDQQSGMISIKESATGFFGSAGGYNQFQVCINPLDGATFTRAPWAVVAAGDTLKLLNPATGLGVTQLAGTLNSSFTCASWYIYSASTSTPGQIDIRGSDSTGAVLPSGANNGPRYNIASSAIPGPVHVALTGTSTVGSTNFANTVNAIKAFKSGVVVTALSQPFIAPGTIGPAGNLTIAETLNGQFMPDEQITCTILSPAANYNPQTFISAANSNDLPIISTNTSSGLIAHLLPFPSGGGYYPNFSIVIDQSAFAPSLGTITVSNLHYQVVSGAVLGPVTVECKNVGHATTKVATDQSPTSWAKGDAIGAGFDAFVSNAIVGTAPTKTSVVIDNDSAAGQVQSGFTIVTKVVKAGSWVTIRFQTTPALAGKPLGVWIAKKNANGTWGAFSAHATVTANGSGVAYYFYRTSSKVWLSFQAKYAGDATFAASQSSGTQVRWN